VLSRFFLNNSNKKMLAPHAVDIAVTISSLTMFHICRTIRRHFSLHQVKLCIGQRKYKQKFTTQGRIDRSTDRSTKGVNSLNSYFAFCKLVVKMKISSSVKSIIIKKCHLVKRKKEEKRLSLLSFIFFFFIAINFIITSAT